jgi:hypothetical protein
MDRPSFTSQELENMNDWPIYSKRPLEISPEKWAIAIESEIIAEICEYYDFIERLKFGKPKRNYDSQRNMIILALKTIYFEKCPTIFVDKHGNIYVYQVYGNGFILPQFTEDGYLGFIGNGNVCVITPESNNVLLAIYYNIDTKEKRIHNISKNDMDTSLANNERIKLEHF